MKFKPGRGKLQSRRRRLAQLENQRYAAQALGERKCVHCGCTDNRACPGGCYWVKLDPPVCSRCT